MDVNNSVQPSPLPQGPSEVGNTPASGAPAQNPNKTDGSTVIRNLDDLKELAPEVYEKQMEALAADICKQLRQSQERYKKAVRGQG